MGNLFQQAKNWLASHEIGKMFALSYIDQHLTLFKTDEPKLGGISVDFLTGKMAHRRRFGGGRREAIAKAVGIKGNNTPTVIDATAGLGQDAFVLASVGCQVAMFERHPVVAALLEDGLIRAYQDAQSGLWLQDNLKLVYRDSLEGLINSERRDVVYLDPMFPHRQKTALVKKEMRIFQELVGQDDDANSLLNIAKQIANKRVVVKRPDYAPFLADEIAHSSIKTKNHRFDIYIPN